MNLTMPLHDDFNPNSVILHDERAAMFTDDYLGNLADCYESAFKFGRKKITQALEEWLSSLNRNSLILDLGCGPGYFMRFLSSRSYHVLGVDLSTQMLKELKSRWPKHMVCKADAKMLPFPDNSFDAVLSIETIRYFRNRHLLLNEIHRVLKPRGKVFITAAPLFSLNFYGIYNNLCWLLGMRKAVSCYQSFETVKSLRFRLVRAGFRKIDISGYFFGPYFLIDKFVPGISLRMLKNVEKADAMLSRARFMSNLANHLVAVAVKN